MGWLSEGGGMSRGVAGFPARRMPPEAPEGVGRQRRCDAAESIDIPVSTWDTIQRIHVGPRGLRGNRIKEALACLEGIHRLSTEVYLAQYLPFCRCGTTRFSGSTGKEFSGGFQRRTPFLLNPFAAD